MIIRRLGPLPCALLADNPTSYIFTSYRGHRLLTRSIRRPTTGLSPPPWGRKNRRLLPPFSAPGHLVVTTNSQRSSQLILRSGVSLTFWTVRHPPRWWPPVHAVWGSGTSTLSWIHSSDPSPHTLPKFGRICACGGLWGFPQCAIVHSIAATVRMETKVQSHVSHSKNAALPPNRFREQFSTTP